jgi:c(7)-type cytochrome triheme protein
VIRLFTSFRFLFAAAGLLLAEEKAAAPEQPIPYSHKTHVGLGLKCAACHKNPDPGEAMGFPAENFCLGCHQTVKKESPQIQKLAQAARDKKPIEWLRVYQIPPYVYFSHRVHTQAGATCETCHGPVRERTVITREVQHHMRDCMACHNEKKARNDCATCHEEK